MRSPPPGWAQVPSSAGIALSLMQREQSEAAEKAAIKRLVLAANEQDEMAQAEAARAEAAAARARGGGRRASGRGGGGSRGGGGGGPGAYYARGGGRLGPVQSWGL